MLRRKVLLVGNPTAQSGRNQERIERAGSLLKARGCPFELIPTEPEGRTIGAIVSRLHATPECMLTSMGGDGTFAEVARALVASGRAEDVPLAMLPTGTANDQGKSFGLDADESALERNIEVMLAGVETRLDVGRLRASDSSGLRREELFFDSAGWGISPRTLKVRNEDREAVAKVPILRAVYRDQLVYAGALLRTFLASYIEEQKFDAEIEADGVYRKWEGLTDLVIKGTRIYGGMWVVEEKARHDDGLFEIVPFQGKRDWASKALVLLKGNNLDLPSLEKIGLKHSGNMSARRIRLHLRPRPGGLPIVAQLDGDVFETTPEVDIEVLPRMIRLVVPAEEGKKSVL